MNLVLEIKIFPIFILSYCFAMSPGDHSLNRLVTQVKIFEGSFRILKGLHEDGDPIEDLSEAL